MSEIKDKKYCCDTMEFHLTTESEKLVEYELMNREYSLIVAKSAYGTHQPILFCPWCGHKFPKSLCREWEELVLKEFGITEYDYWNEDKIPPEFKTDEWWKKRGL